MSDYYGVNRSDEYLEHWKKTSHKYIKKVPSGKGWRYLYTPAEVAAYLGGGVRSIAGKAGSAVSGALSSVRRKAGRAANKAKLGFSLGSKGMGVGSKDLATRVGAAVGGAARRAGQMAKSLGRDASYAVKRARGLLGNADLNGREKMGTTSATNGSDAVQTQRKKNRTHTGNRRNNNAPTNAKGNSDKRKGNREFGSNVPGPGKSKETKKTGVIGAAASKVKSKVLKKVGAKNSMGAAFDASDKRARSMYGRSLDVRQESNQSQTKKRSVRTGSRPGAGRRNRNAPLNPAHNYETMGDLRRDLDSTSFWRGKPSQTAFDGKRRARKKDYKR